MERVSVARDESGAESSVLKDGSVVGGYTLRHFGFGGMSTVYRGMKDGRCFLVKEVDGTNSGEVLALTQEKGLLERLDHAGIVQFEALFEENGYYYMVQEFIEGVSLEERKESGPPVSEEEAREWALQLCDIFEYLHNQTPPIIYRDLKPANLILKDGKLHLIDFGIARVHKDSRAQDTNFMGSFFTASPEHHGAGQTDARSDVFSLGATIYDLLIEGQQRGAPFNHPPLRQVNDSVSQELEAIVAKCLQLKPEDRYQSMGELRLALDPESAQEELQPEVSPPSAPTRSFPKWAIAMMAVAILALAAATFRPGKAGHSHDRGPTEDTGLISTVFDLQDRSGVPVITLGEEIGLFRVLPKESAQDLVERLNKLYHTQCPTCGVYRLEPEGIRIGTYTDPQTQVSSTAVFYAHNDPDAEGRPQWRGITLLTLVNQEQAERMSTTPRMLAGYWRDLLRDLVEISRGRESSYSPLSSQLRDEMLQARARLGEEASMRNLWEVLQELTGERALLLRSMFEKVPDNYRCRSDLFKPFKSYAPLKA